MKCSFTPYPGAGFPPSTNRNFDDVTILCILILKAFLLIQQLFKEKRSAGLSDLVACKPPQLVSTNDYLLNKLQLNRKIYKK